MTGVFDPELGRLLEGSGRGLSQIHNQDLVGRMQAISGNPSVNLPPGINVDQGVRTTFDIGSYQRRTLYLIGDGETGGPAPGILQYVWGGAGSELAQLVNSARAFSIGRCSFIYIQGGGGANDCNVALNVLFSGGAFSPLVACPKNDFIPFVGAQTTNISLGEIQDMYFDKGPVYEDTDPNNVTNPLNFGTVQFIFDFRVSAATYSVDSAFVPLQLYF